MASYLFRYSWNDAGESRMIRRSKQSLSRQKRWFEKRYPDCLLISVAEDLISPLIAELRAENGNAYQRLREKARWERMTLSAVILDWGDPRAWDATPTSANRWRTC